MSGHVDVLSVMDALIALMERGQIGVRGAVEARDAVAELIEKSRRLEVTANSLRYCYSKRPENFASCFQQLDEDAAELRAALARLSGAPQ